ncbi:hypothetical protein DKY63_08465 [Pseudomonas putida]|uniref:Uncharacterized protein n=1 Tax=Pseudomonas putida TaxID=303 RepID=A0A2Z4RI20_PSEPU|nr:hypothetical protein DKY63_08465 [Pseudomonas putida]
MVVNDNAGNQMPSGALESIASRLAPTGKASSVTGSVDAIADVSCSQTWKPTQNLWELACQRWRRHSKH